MQGLPDAISSGFRRSAEWHRRGDRHRPVGQRILLSCLRCSEGSARPGGKNRSSQGTIVTLSLMEPIRDQYGRSFRTLRVSLLSQCNLGCAYCVAAEEDMRGLNDSPGHRGLAVRELLGL